MASFDTIKEAVRATGMSGVVTIDIGDQRVFELAAGYSHRPSKTPNTTTTRFAIASGSKGFTALAVMKLIEDGKLELDSLIRTILGDSIPGIDDRVTVRHLLTHCSGIEDYLDESEMEDISDYVLTVPVHRLTTAEAFMPMLKDLGQETTPGQNFKYSNAGFIILAIILERVTGEGFHDVIQRLVLDPAGMTETGYPRLDELPADCATGYVDGLRNNTLHLPVRGNGDGGAYSTASDLHAFWQAVFSGAIIPAETFRHMIERAWHVPEEDMGYGIGFWLDEDGERVTLEGYDAGVSFRTTHNPRTDATVTVISNTSEGAWPVIGETMTYEI